MQWGFIQILIWLLICLHNYLLILGDIVEPWLTPFAKVIRWVIAQAPGVFRIFKIYFLGRHLMCYKINRTRIHLGCRQKSKVLETCPFYNTNIKPTTSYLSKPQYLISNDVNRSTPSRQVSSGTHMVHQ